MHAGPPAVRPSVRPPWTHRTVLATAPSATARLGRQQTQHRTSSYSRRRRRRRRRYPLVYLTAMKLKLSMQLWMASPLISQPSSPSIGQARLQDNILPAGRGQSSRAFGLLQRDVRSPAKISSVPFDHLAVAAAPRVTPLHATINLFIVTLSSQVALQTSSLHDDRFSTPMTHKPNAARLDSKTKVRSATEKNSY